MAQFGQGFDPPNLVPKLQNTPKLQIPKSRNALGNLGDFLLHSHTLPLHEGNVVGCLPCLNLFMSVSPLSCHGLGCDPRLESQQLFVVMPKLKGTTLLRCTTCIQFALTALFLWLCKLISSRTFACEFALVPFRSFSTPSYPRNVTS
jgi:hypothetical protein